MSDAPFDDLPPELQTLARKVSPLVRILLPHSWLDDDAYLAVSARLCTTPEITDMLMSVCARFERQLGCSITAASTSALCGLLRSSEGEPFFRVLLNRSIRHLYDDPNVWSGCGYEGVHGCRGREQRDGIADATWLPEPEVEETR